MLGQRVGLVLVAGLALGSVACARGQNGAAGPKQPMGHVEVKHLESPDDAPDEAKTVEVAYVFDRDIVNKDFDKTFKDGFEKKGVKVDEELSAHAHFGVNQAKITGTVTYVKKSMGRFSIIEANLVAEAHYEADVQLDLDVKVKGDTKNAGEKDWDGTAMGGKPFTLVKNVMPTNIPIAGPLFLHAHFDLTAACDLGVEGQMHATTGVGIKGDVRLAAKYKKAGFEPKEEGGKKSRFAFEAKTPNFELAPKPYVKVEGKQQSIKGKCSLQPTAVLLLEHSVGAKLMVEPWVELDASRPSSKAPWKLDAQAGVSVNAATDIELFGRQMRKPKEYTLFEVALTKKGDAMGSPAPRLPGGPTAPQTKGARPAQEIARAGGSAPAEDLRTADARPAPSPYAAEAPAAPAAPAPAPATPAAPAVASAPAPAPTPAATPTTTPAAAAADLARTSPVALTRASVASAATPAPAPAAETASAASSAPADKPKDPKDTKDTSTKSNEVASAAPTPPTTTAEPDAAPAEPAQKPKRGKKSRKDSASTTASAPDSAPAAAPEPTDKKKKPSLLDVGLGKPVADAAAGRKPDIAAGVSKLVRKKRKD